MRRFHHLALLVIIGVPFLSSCIPLPPEPYLEIREAKFGTYKPTGGIKPKFNEASEIPLVVGNHYGWYARVKTNREEVIVTEEITFPSAVKWKQSKAIRRMMISNDGRTAIYTYSVKPNDDLVSHFLSITPEYPPGVYKIRVTIEKQKTIEFHFSFVDQRKKN